MVEGSSLIRIEDLTKPATVLIEKISEAVGGIFKPYQIRRLAKAEADAEIIRTESELEIYGLQKRAFLRLVAEEAKKQDNIENITAKAIPLLTESSNPSDMESDWIANFFDKCRLISDGEMQALWSRILAGEANAPGTFSKRTVNLLGSLDKTDAELFSRLCSFVWQCDDEPILLVYDYQTEPSLYVDQKITFNNLSHLDNIGLINFGIDAVFQNTKLPKILKTRYFGTSLNIEFKNTANNNLPIGCSFLTKTGEQLCKVCGAKPIDGFFDYVIDIWAKDGFILSTPLTY